MSPVPGAEEGAGVLHCKPLSVLELFKNMYIYISISISISLSIYLSIYLSIPLEPLTSEKAIGVSFMTFYVSLEGPRVPSKNV